MKWARLPARIILISLAAVVCIGFTGIYARSMRNRPIERFRQRARHVRPTEPQLGRLPSFVGEGILVALFAVMGRIVFRLRLVPAPRKQEQMVFLELHRGMGNSPTDS